MNGRVFDPYSAHFLSPDNIVQAPGFTQSYNRYSYCMNNPMKYNDPSGWSTEPIPCVPRVDSYVFYSLGDYEIYLQNMRNYGRGGYINGGGFFDGGWEGYFVGNGVYMNSDQYFDAAWGALKSGYVDKTGSTAAGINAMMYVADGGSTKTYHGSDASAMTKALQDGYDIHTGRMPDVTYKWVWDDANSKLLTDGYRAPIAQSAQSGGDNSEQLSIIVSVVSLGVSIAGERGYNASIGIWRDFSKIKYYSSGWTGSNQYVSKTVGVAKGATSFLWGADLFLNYSGWANGRQSGLETGLNVGVSTTSLIVGGTGGIGISAGYAYLNYMWNSIIDYGNSVHQLYRDTYQQYFQGTPYGIPNE